MAEEEQATKADADVDNKNGTSDDVEEDDDEDEEENEEKEAVSHSFKVHEFHNLKIFRRLTAAFIGKRGRLTNFFKYVAKMDSNGVCRCEAPFYKGDLKFDSDTQMYFGQCYRHVTCQDQN